MEVKEYFSNKIPSKYSKIKCLVQNEDFWSYILFGHIPFEENAIPFSIKHFFVLVSSDENTLLLYFDFKRYQSKKIRIKISEN